MRTFTALLLLALTGAAAAASITIENPNSTDATVRFYWIEGDYSYGPYTVPAGTTRTFEVEAGTYDIRIDNGNGEVYVIEEAQVGEQDSGFYHVVKE